MGGIFTKEDNTKYYLIKIHKTKNLDELRELEGELLVEFHWSEEHETETYMGLLQYVRLKIGLYIENNKNNNIKSGDD